MASALLTTDETAAPSAEQGEAPAAAEESVPAPAAAEPTAEAETAAPSTEQREAPAAIEESAPAPEVAETAAEAAPAEGAAVKAEGEAKPRTRVGRGRYVGLVVEWKGYMGWIQPLVKIQHEQAKRHGGRIYLNQKDIATSPPTDGSSASDFPLQRVKEGKVVDFFAYLDADGLGAEECRARSVLRITLPHSEAGRKLRDSPQWSEYLSDSEYYPAFERDHGVLLRKYTWPLSFVVLELWGHPEDLITSALRLSTPQEAKDTEDCDVRLLLLEDDIPKVESLPGNPKVSSHVVVPRPLPCRSLMLQTSREACAEGIRAFLRLMGPVPAPAGGGA